MKCFGRCQRIISSMHRSKMLLNYTPWSGLEAYWRGVTVTNYFAWKWGKKTYKVSMGGRSMTYIYHWSHFFWVNVTSWGVLCLVNSMFWWVVITLDCFKIIYCNLYTPKLGNFSFPCVVKTGNNLVFYVRKSMGTLILIYIYMYYLNYRARNGH